ncbi:MAG: hypothetical protein A2029_06960 [Chloroflexi bacterium RBG_19FT_COMBO_47_9]|nr:MAG: hypothetical protein A2029_06960 [Chloroflexi bacterium RBG_19FT_COMBO_47_9]
MICPYCGKENPENLSLCSYCGGRLMDMDERNTTEIFPPETVYQSAPSPAEPGFIDEQPTTQPDGSPPEIGEVLDQPMAQFDLDNFEPPQTSAKPSKRGCDRYIGWLVGCFVVLCLTLSCVAVFWGFYNFSNTLDFIKAATPTPSLLLSDDFSDPNSGWPSTNEPDYLDDYYNGAYRMVENLVNTTSWAYPDSYSFTDVSINVDATKNGGPDENDMGVICRFQDDDHFYFGLITSDGYYGIIKMNLGEFSVLGAEYLAYSDLINQGSASNHIRLDCIGDVLTLYANGHQLDLQTDAEYTHGNVGLIIGTYETPGTDILYDNFTVQQQ